MSGRSSVMGAIPATGTGAQPSDLNGASSAGSRARATQIELVAPMLRTGGRRIEAPHGRQAQVARRGGDRGRQVVVAVGEVNGQEAARRDRPHRIGQRLDRQEVDRDRVGAERARTSRSCVPAATRSSSRRASPTTISGRAAPSPR